MTWSGRSPGGFGAILRGLRIRAGLSQDQLAGKARLSVRAVRELEAGRVARPQSRTVHRLVTALDLPAADAQALLAAVGAGESAGLRVGILGPLSLRRGATPVTVSRPKLKALLALLALDPRRAVPTDEIITVLWGVRAPLSAPSQVQVYVTQLRQLIEPTRGPRRPPDRVVRSSDGYRLMIREEESDAAAFRHAAARAATARKDGDTGAAARLYADALGHWRGPVLADVPVLGHHPEAVALTRQRIDAAVAFADLAEDRDAHARAGHWMQELAHDEPLHEALAARLMLALAANGEQAAALALYDRIRTRLGEELGVDPGDELQDARLRVLRQQTGPATPAAGSPRAPVPAQLPLGLRGFTGRQAALAELDGLPGDVVISAVSGSAGVGKTTLAVHWAHRVASRFPDGQLYVDLRGFDPGRPGHHDRGGDARLPVRARHAAPERMPTDVDAQAALYRSMLAGRRMLVVLDNARDADQVRPLLPGTATAFTVVTSRNQLGRAGRDARRAPARPGPAVRGRGAPPARLAGSGRTGSPPNPRPSTPSSPRVRTAAAGAGDRGRPRRSRPGGALATVAAELTAERLDALDAGDPASRIRAVFSWSYSALTPPAARLFRLLGLHPGPDIDAVTAASLAGSAVPEADRLSPSWPAPTC